MDKLPTRSISNGCDPGKKNPAPSYGMGAVTITNQKHDVEVHDHHQPKLDVDVHDKGCGQPRKPTLYIVRVDKVGEKRLE